MNYIAGKIHIEDYQHKAFEDSTLHVIHESETFNAYKLVPKGRFHWCTIIDTGFCLVIGGDQGFALGANNVAATMKMARGAEWFASMTEDDVEYMAEKFFGRKPSPKAYEALDRWSIDVSWMMALQKEFSRLYIAHMDAKEKTKKKK